MKHIVMLLFIFISLIGCDGRDRAYKTNHDALKDNNLLESFSENIQYFPESYSETVTDTILNNDSRIVIKLNTDMNSSVLKNITKDTILYKNYYRNFDAHVTIYKNDNEIFDKIIDKTFFKESINSPFNLENSILQHVWLDEMANITENQIVIDFTFTDTNKNIVSIYQINIDINGNYKIKKQLEESHI